MELAQQFHGESGQPVRATARRLPKLPLKLCRSPRKRGSHHDVYLPLPGARAATTRPGAGVAYLLLVDPLDGLNRLSQRKSRWPEKFRSGSLASCCPGPRRGPAGMAETRQPGRAGAGALCTPSPPPTARCSKLGVLRRGSPVGDRQPAALPSARQNPARQGLIACAPC